MALVLLASATGSPGVTTTALGLALNWPRHVVLADADRDPAQAIQAGYLKGVDLGRRGLRQVAKAHRERRPVTEELWLQTVPLDESGTISRRFLPGFDHPGAANLFEPVWSEVASGLAGLGVTGTDALVDCGRVGRGLPAPLLAEADLLAVCVRSSLRGLAALRLHLPPLVQLVEGSSGHCQLGLLVVGPGRPYASREIERQFGVPVLAELAWEPRQAAVLSDGETPPRSFGDGALARSQRRAATELDERIRLRTEVIGGTRDPSWWQQLPERSQA